MAELDSMEQKPNCSIKKPMCSPANNCFVASYMTPSKSVFVNTYLTRPDKRYQLVGPSSALRGYQFNCVAPPQDEE